MGEMGSELGLCGVFLEFLRLVYGLLNMIPHFASDGWHRQGVIALIKEVLCLQEMLLSRGGKARVQAFLLVFTYRFRLLSEAVS